MIKRLAAAATLLAASAAPAFAHLDPAEHGSFLAGVSHPLFGADHILAMVAVGLWAALLVQNEDRRALWLVPTAFVGTMCLGFAAALSALPLPFVEPVILASVVVIGLLAAVGLGVPASLAMVMVGFFAFFHGHAHGGELGSAGALSFGAGFALATAALHAAGITLGLGLGRMFGGKAGHLAARLAGGAAALGGLWLAVAG
jgi:urease accessory protein